MKLQVLFSLKDKSKIKALQALHDAPPLCSHGKLHRGIIPQKMKVE